MDNDTESAISILLLFAMTPPVIYLSATYSYWGLILGKTLGHFGLRTGLLARLYGLFYASLAVLSTTGFLYSLYLLMQFSFSQIIEAVIEPLQPQNYPFGNIVVAVVGIILIIMGYVIIRIKLRRDPAFVTNLTLQSDLKLTLYLAGAAAIMSSFLAVPGAPAGCMWLPMLAYLYFSADPHRGVRLYGRSDLSL